VFRIPEQAPRAEMTMNGAKIVFIVVLVVFAVLFAGGIGLGLGSNGASPGNARDLQNSWLSGLRQSLAPAKNLKLEDVEKGAPPGCIQSRGFVIQRSQSCKFTVQSSFWPVRKQLSLRLSQGSVAEIRLRPNVAQNKAGLTATQILSTTHPEITKEEKQKLEVYKDGGTLIISCGGNGTTACRLDVR
jgi:hypothetical protein